MHVFESESDAKSTMLSYKAVHVCYATDAWQLSHYSRDEERSLLLSVVRYGLEHGRKFTARQWRLHGAALYRCMHRMHLAGDLQDARDAHSLVSWVFGAMTVERGADEETVDRAMPDLRRIAELVWGKLSIDPCHDCFRRSLTLCSCICLFVEVMRDCNDGEWQAAITHHRVGCLACGLDGNVQV